MPDPALLRVDRGERDARDGGRQGERQIDEGVDEPAARELVAHEDPGEQDAEDHVDQRAHERRAEAQAVRGEHARTRHRGPELRPAHRGALEDHGGEREEHDQRQVQHGEAHGEPEPREDRVPPPETADHDRSFTTTSAAITSAGRSRRRCRRRRSAWAEPCPSRRRPRRW